MTGQDHGVCTDCGEHTPLRLPRRFPHICTTCLFPPPKLDASESQQDAITGPGRITMVQDLLDRNLAIGAIHHPGFWGGATDRDHP